MTNGQRVLNGVLAIAVVGLGAAGFSSVGNPAKAKLVIRTAAVQRGDVMSTVSASGNVITPTDLNLNFTTGGKLAEIDVKVGDHVTSGQVLARVDDTSQQASLQSAQANLAASQAKLVQIQNPVTPSQAAANNASLAQAAQSVTNAQTALADTQRILAGNATSYQNAINQAQSQLGTDQSQQSTDQNQLTADQNQQTADQNQLAADQAKAQQDQGNQTQEQADQQAITADQQKVSSDQQKVSADQTKVNQDNQTVAKDQQAVTNAQQAQTQGLAKDQQTLDQAQQQVTNAQQAYQTAAANNAAKSAPPAAGDLAAAQASVTQAQAAVSSAQQAEDGTVLKAPQDGTIGTVNGIVGQTVSGGGTSSSSSSSSSAASSSSSSSSSANSSSGFIRLVDLNGLQVKAGFSETDAASVKVGQPATVTFPALPTEELGAHVVAVDTTSTVVSNVVTYYVTMQIDNPTTDVKPGMTANVSVVTAKADNVLHVPSAAVRGSGGTATLQVMKNGKQSPVTVTVGVRGDTAVEVDSGVAAGDQVVVSTGTTGSTTQTSTPRFGGGLGGGLGGGGFVGRGG